MSYVLFSIIFYESGFMLGLVKCVWWWPVTRVNCASQAVTTTKHQACRLLTLLVKIPKIAISLAVLVRCVCLPAAFA